MTPDQFQLYMTEMKEHISLAVTTTVNGKIDKLNTKMDRFIEQDTAWKQNAAPVLKLGQNISGFGKGVAYIIGIIAGIGAAWGMISWLGTKLFAK